MHADILAVLRAGQRKPQLNQQSQRTDVSLLPVIVASATNNSSLANAKHDFAGGSGGGGGDDCGEGVGVGDSAAAKDDEGLNLRRATRQRAKARVDAICDVVAITESLVRSALKKISLPAELRDSIKYCVMARRTVMHHLYSYTTMCIVVVLVFFVTFFACRMPALLLDPLLRSR